MMNLVIDPYMYLAVAFGVGGTARSKVRLEV